VSSISLMLPIKTISESNYREHWAVKARRAKKQRTSACLLAQSVVPLLPKTGHMEITLTRIGARKLDSDNLAGSQKHVQDGVADALKIDDGSSRLTWIYKQEKGKAGEYAVRLTIKIV